MDLDVQGGILAPAVHRVAIIGSGPRGMSVLERLIARLVDHGPGTVEIYLIDSHEIGCGRIWRRDQPHWYLMNTVADEVSAFSGIPDGGKARPGAGPSLAQWWSARDPQYPGPNSYASRAMYGEYMQFVLKAIEDALPVDCALVKVAATVDDIEATADGVRLVLDSRDRLWVDRVVVATGHTLPQLDSQHRRYEEFANSNEKLRYIRGDSAADMSLEKIPSGSRVGVIGMGLSFFDVVAALTVGRGGAFKVLQNGDLEYVPSGSEPLIYAGSRSGVPIPARGLNQKDPNYRMQPAVFTKLRADALRERGHVDFKREVLPLLLAEVDMAFYQAQIRRTIGNGRDVAFRLEVIAQQLTSRDAIRDLAERYGCTQSRPLDLDTIADPFAGGQYDHQARFTQDLLEMLALDLRHANEGNVESPLKSALDVIRDSRALIRSIVDYGGLTPQSYRSDFLGWYVPRSAFLSAGPPRVRTAEASALIRSGVLTVIGPRMQVEGDTKRGAFICVSPQVGESATPVEILVDARIPVPCIARDTSILLRRLYSKGLFTSFINHGVDEEFDTGGVAVTPAPFHPITGSGSPQRNLYVIGIPTEHTRWFMQAGSSRPGFWTDFFVDADAIAAHIVDSVVEARPTDTQYTQWEWLSPSTDEVLSD